MKFKLLYILLLCLLFGNLAYGQTRKIDSLSKEIERFRNIPGKTKDTAYINLLNAYAQWHYYVNNDTVKLYAEKSLQLANEIDYPKGIIEANNNLGFYYSELGEYKKSIPLVKKALEKALEINNLQYILTCYNSLSIFYDYDGDIKNSVEASLTAINIGEKAKDKTKDELLYLGMAYENLGLTYGTQKEYHKALNLLEKTQKINEQTGHVLAQGQTLSNLADFQLRVKEFDKGFENIEKSISIFKELGYNDWLAFALMVKAKLFVETERHEEALKTFMESLSLYEKIDDPRGKTSLLNGIAEAYCHLNEFDLAKTYAEEALTAGKALNSFEEIKQSAEILSYIYKQTRDYEKALTYHEQFKNYTDSIFNSDNTKGLAAHEAQMNYIEKENQLVLGNEKKLNKQRLLIYLSSGGVIILLTVLFFTQRSRKLEKKLNNLLAKKNADLEKRENELEELNDTKNKLFSIIAHDLRTPIASLNSLIDLLKNNEIDADDFMQFTSNLSEQVKNISFTLNNLLVWGQAQMKSGAITRPSKIDLKQISDETLKLLNELALKKHINITNKIQDDTIVYVDADQITLVFRNLIDNAIKFTPENGAIAILATEKEDSFQVEIKDSGIGMNQKDIDNILYKKTHFNSTYGTNNEKGTGLGLKLCKEMIDKNNGKLSITSTLASGTSFFFTLPKK
ncbi:tetratricopeptide repeat-containing sensor histidine kinase [Galbibacter sp. EGI 63066]|uniref:tetratricopeptide repeat-containing sensor histidine kinase n=1 Tax=Galbibacter sp. EGI 63066 TaxID=2993559 RepID=UPI0022489CC9|nr:tetratricopeptide repeat-containing sensor histidine kinase [Galbibacter sp. EGI 63066]MCX2678462.1 tetratricopeptide repeat-containing sensor histidine kinase [Galbibacter sp. EGI 63066]